MFSEEHPPCAYTGMKWRVSEQKSLLVQAIKQQEEGGLAREVLEHQLRMGWPGLAMEVSHICKKTRIPDATQEGVSKDVISKAVRYDHLRSLKLELRGKKLQENANSYVSGRRQYTS